MTVSSGTCSSVCCCVVALACLVCTFVVHVMAWVGADANGLFTTHEPAVWSQPARPPLTAPRPWLLVLWTVTYAWTAAWLLYGLETSVRQGRQGHGVSGGVGGGGRGVIPPAAYCATALAIAALLAWLALFLHPAPALSVYSPVALVVSLGAGITSLICTLKALARFVGVTKKLTSPEVILTRMLAVNGQGFFSAWVLTVLLYDLSGLLVRTGLVADPNHAALIFMGVSLLLVILLFTADVFLVRGDVSTFVVTPYVVPIVTSAQVVSVNVAVAGGSGGAVFVMGCVMAVLTVLILIGKIAADVLKSWRLQGGGVVIV